MYSLRQLVGKRQARDGVESVALPMDEVLKEDQTKTNGVRRVGFISRHDGATLIFVRGVPAGEQQEALEAVKEIRAAKDYAVADETADPAELPPELIEAEEEELDDE